MRWITARFDSPCLCGHKVLRGEKLLAVDVRRSYRSSPYTRYLCQQCGEQHERENAAADFDEMQYASGCGGY